MPRVSIINSENVVTRFSRITISLLSSWFTVLPHERCKLYCETDSNQCYPLAEKVIDGTPCDQDTFHICVNGFCKPAGCDHVLNSTAELDICGVCKGDNSTCQWITGSYNSTQYGYTRIAKIPAGSNNIDIRQPGWKDMIDDGNYLGTWFVFISLWNLNGMYLILFEIEIFYFENISKDLPD